MPPSLTRHSRNHTNSFKKCEITKNINSKAIPNQFYNKIVITLIKKLIIMIKTGTKVKWNWGKGTANGKVEKTYTKKVTKTIKGTEVTRKGEVGNKALYIKQNDGDYVLKSENEVERAD